MKKHMEKAVECSQRWIIGGCFIYIGVMLIESIFVQQDNTIATNICEGILVVLTVWVTINGILAICSSFAETVREIKNVQKKSGIPVWDRLDNYLKTTMGHVNEEYIGLINYYYYSENSPVIKFAKKNAWSRLDLLIRRKDYLKTNLKKYDARISQFVSVILSIIATMIITLVTTDVSQGQVKKISEINSFQWTIIVIGCVFVCMFFFLKWASRGQMGSYDYIVNEYELSILDEEIEKELRSISIREEDAPYVEMKQMVIGYYNESRRGGGTRSLDERKKNRENLMNLHIGELDRNHRMVSMFRGDKQLLYYNDDLQTRDLPSDYKELSTWIKDNDEGLEKYYKSHYYSEIKP